MATDKSFFKDEYVECKHHLEFIRYLPCIVTGRVGNCVTAHHLLRDTGQKGMGIKSGDDKTIPLLWEVHEFLHRNGDENACLHYFGVYDKLDLVRTLWGISGNTEAAKKIIAARYEKNWVKNRESIKCSNRILRPATKPMTASPTNRVNWTKS